MTLTEIIAQRIPPAMLERVVFDQGIVERSVQLSIFKQSDLSALAIAEKIVEVHGDRAARLAFGLYEQVRQFDWDTAGKLYDHFKGRDQGEFYNQQASLVGRVPTLPLQELNEFLESVRRQVCLIVSRKGETGAVLRGTGFLVAPDLVLTCRHVLRDFPDLCEVLSNGSCIELYFDFHRGDPVDRVSANLPDARKVGVAKQWHVASRDDVIPDGIADHLSDEEEARIRKALDFVLLRLDQPIGLQPLDRSGGRRRGWVTLPKDEAPQGLQYQDWIIIPQHPSGFPQRIDLGRYLRADQTGTRIRYDTNTAKGTSGAPCFNQTFELVGVHNAYVGPEENPLANQAIRFDHIAALVRTHIKIDAVDDPIYSLRWSTTRDDQPPRVILGRDKLLQWLKGSANVVPTTLADRVYAALSTDAGAGCSFSSEVLHAEIRDSKTPRAVYGHNGQQLPGNVEDFLRSLLRELGIDVSKLDAADQIPERPRNTAVQGIGASPSAEVDKLERWLSDELPTWLGGIITKHVEYAIDVRPAAQEAVRAYERRGAEAPAELKAQATAPEPIIVRPNAWRFAYVIFDDLRSALYAGKGPRTELKGEVYALVAALVKGKPESAMDPGLKRLRWMFLGYLPDFIAPAGTDGNGAAVESLDPAAIGTDEILALFDRMSRAYLPLNKDRAPELMAILKALVQSSNDEGIAARLSKLQHIVSLAAGNLRTDVEQ